MCSIKTILPAKNIGYLQKFVQKSTSTKRLAHPKISNICIIY